MGGAVDPDPKWRLSLDTCTKSHLIRWDSWGGGGLLIKGAMNVFDKLKTLFSERWLLFTCGDINSLFLTDIEDPKIKCPTSQSAKNTVNKATGVVTWTGPEASDNSGLSPNISCTIKSGSQFAIGQTEVICQARDGFGNRAECTFTVEIKGKHGKHVVYLNDLQLAKFKKSIPLMLLPWNLQERSRWAKKLQLYLKNYVFSEYVICCNIYLFICLLIYWFILLI